MINPFNTQTDCEIIKAMSNSIVARNYESEYKNEINSPSFQEKTQKSPLFKNNKISLFK